MPYPKKHKKLGESTSSGDGAGQAGVAETAVGGKGEGSGGKGKGGGRGGGKGVGGFGKGDGRGGGGGKGRGGRGGHGKGGHGKGGGGPPGVDLGQCRTPNEVTRALEGHALTAQQASHAVFLLTKLHGGVDYGGGGWAHLAAQLVCGAPELRARQLSTTMYALGKLGSPVGEALGEALGARLAACAVELDTIGVSNTLWSCAKAGWTPRPACVSALCARLSHLLPELNGQDLANTCVGLGGLHSGGAAPPEATLAGLHRALSAKAAELRPQEICSVLAALAHLPAAPPSTLSALLGAASLMAHRLTPRDVATICHALGRAVCQENAASLDAAALEFLRTAVGAAANRFNAQDVSSALVGLSALVRRDL